MKHATDAFEAKGAAVLPFAQSSRPVRALIEGAGLLRGPRRIVSLAFKLASDQVRRAATRPNLYSYAATRRPTDDALRALLAWILNAQRPDGGIAAYYSLLTGYARSYPEVTGYLVPTLYDLARHTDEAAPRQGAERAVAWLTTLQMASGAFPAGLHGASSQPSVFNTGQILQGLVRAHAETKSSEILRAALAAGDWLVSTQIEDGSWAGAVAYQGVSHTYYTMVSWSLCLLAEESGHSRYAVAADRNIDWALKHLRPTGWIDGINLRRHPTYLHFIAYAIQGILECGILRRRDDAIRAVATSAWALLRKFETRKSLCGTYEPDFRDGRAFSCLTGNAQMSCVWLRLFETGGDLRYLNAALKINEMLKQSLSLRGGPGMAGGVAGSEPIWAAYQPLRFISWGGKFLADALLLEHRCMAKLEGTRCES